MPRVGAAFAGITAAMFLGVAACSSGAESDPSPRSSTVTASADLRAVAERWRDLSGSERSAVCEQALQDDGPDYRGMLHALMDTGMKQPGAAEMLPYAVNQCV